MIIIAKDCFCVKCFFRKLSGFFVGNFAEIKKADLSCEIDSLKHIPFYAETVRACLAPTLVFIPAFTSNDRQYSHS